MQKGIAANMQLGFARSDVVEHQLYFISKSAIEGKYRCCPIGATILGMVPYKPTAEVAELFHANCNDENDVTSYFLIEKFTGLPMDLVRAISNAHVRGKSRSWIIERLEAGTFPIEEFV